MRKQFDVTKKLESTLKIRLHKALQEIETLKGGNRTSAGLSSQDRAAQETAPSLASNGFQASYRRSQPLTIRPHPRVEVVDLTSEAGSAGSPLKSTGDGQGEKGPDSENADQFSSSKKDRQKRKRDAESVTPNNEDAISTPGKRRKSRGRRHGLKIKTEPKA